MNSYSGDTFELIQVTGPEAHVFIYEVKNFIDGCPTDI